MTKHRWHGRAMRDRGRRDASRLKSTLLAITSLILAGCAGEPAEQWDWLARADRTELLARLQLGQQVLRAASRVS